jgi:hypothetical protein
MAAVDYVFDARNSCSDARTSCKTPSGPTFAFRAFVPAAPISPSSSAAAANARADGSFFTPIESEASFPHHGLAPCFAQRLLADRSFNVLSLPKSWNHAC